MEKLRQYCEDTFKVDWVLTKDFLFIGHDIIQKKTVDAIAEHGYSIMIVLHEGVLFAFNANGMLRTFIEVYKYTKKDNSIIGGGLRI